MSTDRIVTPRNYLEECEDARIGINSAIRRTFKDLPGTLKVISAQLEDMKKMVDIAHGGELLENYDIEDWENYSWADDLTQSERSSVNEAFNNLCDANDNFNDYLDQVSSICKDLENILENAHYYVLDLEDGVFDN